MVDGPRRALLELVDLNRLTYPYRFMSTYGSPARYLTDAEEFMRGTRVRERERNRERERERDSPKEK